MTCPPPKFGQVAKSGFCSYNEIDQGRMSRKRSEAGSLTGLPYPGERDAVYEAVINLVESRLKKAGSV